MAGGHNIRFNADACALGLLKVPSSSVLTSSSVTQWDRRTFRLPFPTFLSLLGLPSDVIDVGLGVGRFPPTIPPPLHTPEHHIYAQDMKGGFSRPTPPPNTYTAPSCVHDIRSDYTEQFHCESKIR